MIKTVGRILITAGAQSYPGLLQNSNTSEHTAILCFLVNMSSKTTTSGEHAAIQIFVNKLTQT